MQSYSITFFVLSEQLHRNALFLYKILFSYSQWMLTVDKSFHSVEL